MCPLSLEFLKENMLSNIPTKSKSKKWHYSRIVSKDEAICIVYGKHLKYNTNTISTFKYHIANVDKLALSEEF